MPEKKARNKSFQTPILFIVFNRPDVTKKVLDRIREMRPAKLYIAADGPRQDNTADEEKCRQVRTLFTAIDWPCRVKKLFRDTNLGCKKAVSSAIDWFFSQEEEGIILEDDCLPIPAFFHFCRELLLRYRDDPRVMQICGFNPLKNIHIEEDYFFSKYGPVWGWASWRRAWDQYDVNIQSWPTIRDRGLYKAFCATKREALWRRDLFDRLQSGELDTWDFQWVYAKLLLDGLSIVPTKNMVTNIGFGKDATHTFIPFLKNRFVAEDIPVGELKHPPYVIRNAALEKEYRDKHALRFFWLKRVLHFFRIL